MQPLTYKFTLGEDAWKIDFHTITVDDAIELRRLTGLRWLELVQDFDARDALAVKALLYLARKASGETVSFEDITFTMTALRISVVSPALPNEEADEETLDPTQPLADSRT